MTETNKKSRWNQFLEFLSTKEKEKKSEVEIQDLPAGMVKLILDKKLKERDELIEKAFEVLNHPLDTSTLNNYYDDLLDTIKVAHTTVIRAAIPYVRAGDNGVAARLVSGWNEVYGFFSSTCEKSKLYWGSDVKKDEQTKMMTMGEIHARNLHISLMNHYFPLAFKIISFSYKDVDVRPNIVTVIQTMSPLSSRGEGLNVAKELKMEY